MHRKGGGGTTFDLLTVSEGLAAAGGTPEMRVGRANMEWSFHQNTKHAWQYSVFIGKSARSRNMRIPSNLSKMRSRCITVTILKQTEGMPRRHDGASNPPGAQTLSHLVKIHIYDLYLWWSMILLNPVEKLRGCEMPESQSCSLWNHCHGVGLWCKSLQVLTLVACMPPWLTRVIAVRVPCTRLQRVGSPCLSL